MTCMLGVSCSDRDTATPVRRLKLRTSKSEVCACVTLTSCALERKRMVLVTALAAVARNPTISRPACGPMSTGCDRTGFHSEVEAKAEPQLEAKSPEANSPASADLRSGILIGLMESEPSNLTESKMRTMTVNLR